MSDYFDDDEMGNETHLVKDLRRQLKELAKERDALKTEVTEVRGAVRKRSVEEVLASKGVKKGLAKYVLADGVDDEAGVEKWLAENGDLFGVTVQEPEPDADDEAMASIQSSTATGQVSVSRLDQEQQYLDEAQTPDEWKERLKAIRVGAAPFQQK